MIIKTGEVQTQDFTGKTISGFTLVANLISAANDQHITYDDFDSNQLNISVKLLRGGKIYNIIPTVKLGIIAAESVMFSSLTKYLYGADPLELEKGAAIKTLAYVPMMVGLGGPVQLRDGDKLTLMMQSNRGEYGAALDANSCFIKVETVETDLIERAVPLVEVYSVNAGQASWEYSFGDAITSVRYINADKLDTTGNDTVIEQLQVTSDRYNCTDTDNELLTKAIFEAQGDSAAFISQSRTALNFLGRGMCNNVVVNTQLNDANVVSGKNYFIVRRIATSQQLIARANAIETAVQNKDKAILLPNERT